MNKAIIHLKWVLGQKKIKIDFYEKMIELVEYFGSGILAGST